MKKNEEKEIAEDIVSDSWSLCTIEDSIKGWKVSKKRPSWVKNVSEWHKFVRQMEKNHTSSDIDENEDKHEYNDDEEYDEEYPDNERNLNLQQESNDDSGEDNNKSYNQEENSESEEDTKDSYKHNSTSTRKSYNDKNESEEDSDESYKHCDEISKITPADMSNKCEVNDEMFETLFDGDFTSKFDKNIKTASSSKQMEIFITGPFRNSKNGKSNWVVVYGNLNKAYVLKSNFIETYMKTLLSGIKHSNIDINHCETYYDINIRQREFGKSNDWKRTKQAKTISRMSFVFSCDTTNEGNAKECLVETIEVFFKSMAKRKKHPIGPMVIKYLREFQNGLYEYFLKTGKGGKMNDEDAGKKLTDDIHNEFQPGYKLTWNDSLDRYMVDYDIIRILKDYVGCSKWEDIRMKDMKKCYRDFNNEFSLPEWDTQQERF